MSIQTKFLSAVAASMLAFAPAAAGASTVVYTFGNTPKAGGPGGSFLDAYTFSVPSKGYASVSVVSTIGGPLTNVNLFSFKTKLNGTPLAVISQGTSEFFQLSDKVVTAGIQTLTIGGSAQKLGSYTGTFTFAVPEPATWMMMILGFGAVGYAMRRRQAKVSFA